MKRMFTALALGAAMLATGAGAQPPGPPKDALSDPALKPSEVIAFMGLKPGDKVADVVSGRFIRALSRTVGPTGKVYAWMPAEVIKAHPEVMGMIQTIPADPAYANVTLVTAGIDSAPLPQGLDAVFIRQNYHDLHDKFMGPADVAKFNRDVYAALKPGGVYVVLDHAAAPGSGLRDTDTLHRIDPATVKAEVVAAGFVPDGESTMLASAADDHTKMVFDPAVHGKTDQFLYRFRKPR